MQDRAAWFFPLATSALTRAAVPRITSAVAALASSPRLGAAEQAAHTSGLRDTAVSTGLGNGLATFNSQWNSTAGADSVLVTGLFAVGLALLLTCCALAARAYRPELRAAAGPRRQLSPMSGRMLARSGIVAVPAIAVGAAAAIASRPGGAAAGFALGLALAATAVLAMPLICVLQHRLARTGQLAGSARRSTRRSGLRRVVAELAVLAVAVAALADVRLNGAGGGGSGTTAPYLSASAVLEPLSPSVWC